MFRSYQHTFTFLKTIIALQLALAAFPILLLEGYAVLVPDRQIATIVINPHQSYQTMDGIGVNSWTFPVANAMGWQWARVKTVFDDLDIRYLRLVPWFNEWERQNDNEDPFLINWSYWNNRTRDKNFVTLYHDVPFAQYVLHKGIEVQLGIWNGADWLAHGSPRQIDPAKYDELGESISAYLLYLRDRGIPINVIEVQNEPDIEAGIQYESPQALRDAALQVIKQLDRNGLTQVRLHAPNLYSPHDIVQWGQVWFDNPVLAGRTQAVSYHTWWFKDYESFNAIWEFAKSYHKPVWATETGYRTWGVNYKTFNAIWEFIKSYHKPVKTTETGDSSPRKDSDKQPELRSQTWETAWDYAMSDYRAIAWSHASRIYHWALLGHGGVVSKTGELFPSYYILKHFANYIPVGAILVESRTPDQDLLTLAFQRPDGNYTLILLNNGTTEKVLHLSASDDMRFQITQMITSGREHYAVNSTLPVNPDSLPLPAKSIASIVIKPR